MARIEKRTFSDEETTSLGEALGKKLSSHHIVCFFGDLAAGKTTFIKGLVAGVAGEALQYEVNSPTFVYLNIYEGLQTVYHFDLYRLKGSDEFIALGFDEFLSGEGICCIEWAEKIEAFLPATCVRVTLKHEGENCRLIVIDHPMENDGFRV